MRWASREAGLIVVSWPEWLDRWVQRAGRFDYAQDRGKRKLLRVRTVNAEVRSDYALAPKQKHCLIRGTVDALADYAHQVFRAAHGDTSDTGV